MFTELTLQIRTYSENRSLCSISGRVFLITAKPIELGNMLAETNDTVTNKYSELVLPVSGNTLQIGRLLVL